MLASSSLSVVSSAPLAGGVPSSFAVSVGSAPVPSSAFRPALPGAVLLGVPALSSARGGGVLVTVPWSCPVSGLSGSLRCVDRGFASPAEARAFFGALQSAAFSSASEGALFFVGGAPGRRGVLPGWFCAVSSEPFGAASSEPSLAPDGVLAFGG